MAGQGAKLHSSWAWGLDTLGAHLPRKVIQYGDSDAAEAALWQDWFFEAEAAADILFAQIVM